MSSIDFGEKIHPTDRIREVLNSYPFSTTIIRELLANSDDAQATEQVGVCVLHDDDGSHPVG